MDKSSRNLGLMELYQLAKQVTNVYGTLCLTANIKLTLPSSFDNSGGGSGNVNLKSIIYLAVSDICKTIPQLSVSVLDIDTTTPKFLQIHSLDLNNLISFQHCKNRQDISDILENEIKTVYDLNNRSMPLWRLKVITFEEITDEISIIFDMDHIIADGISTTILMKQLIKYLNHHAMNNNNNNTATTEVISNNIVNINLDELVLNGALDQRTPHHPGLLELMPVIVKHILVPTFLQKYIYGTPSFWAGEKPAVKENHNTRVKVLQYDQLPALLSKCRDNNTTPHAAIYMAIVMATLKVYGNDLQLSGATPYSARKYCEPVISDEEVGNFVSGYDRVKDYKYSFLSEPLNFWSECKQYKQEISQYLIKGIKLTNMLKHVGSFPQQWSDFWLKRLESFPFGRNCSFEFSDLGNVDFGCKDSSNDGADEQQPFHLKSAIFAQSANVVGSTFNINTITTNEILQISLTWQQDAISDENATLLINNLNEILNNIVSSF